MNVSGYLETSAARWPDRPAVVDPDGRALSYADLNRQANGLAAFLAARGVKRGDRVGVVLPKSHRAVVALFGIMKAGAAYVPVDATGPAPRGRQILADCGVRAVIAEGRALAFVPDTPPLAALVVAGTVSEEATPPVPVTSFGSAVETRPAGGVQLGPDDLLYVLYTSGSTGKPKGAMITHGNVLSFVDWCSAEFAPTERDRFANHAPFHFDPSVFDLYVAIRHGASVHLISEDLSRRPRELAALITARRITVWCSTPSILMLLEELGDLASHTAPDLRLVLSGGEVFPVPRLRALQRKWPSATYCNVYGPTEATTFCTLARIPRVIPDDRQEPYPIGRPGPHLRCRVLDGDGREVPAGGEGLLHVSGSQLFSGYWNDDAQTATVFADQGGARWYDTGDVVRREADGNLTYVGRRDRMVKRRGYRIELGDVEQALHGHSQVREAAVVTTQDSVGARIVAVVSAGDPAPSVVELKRFCATRLPAYMSPDRFVFTGRLPRTTTDKIDYRALERSLCEPALHREAS